MKKIIIIALSLLVLSGLVAVEFKYWETIRYFYNIPEAGWSDGGVTTRAATVFSPAGTYKLDGVYFPFYGAEALGQPNVRVEIWPVNQDGSPDQSGMFPLAGVTVNYANLVNYSQFNYVDFSAADLTFGPDAANGAEFAMVVSVPNGNAGIIEASTLHDEAVRGNSYHYAAAPEDEWYMWYDFAFSAEITYLGDQVDVVASTLYFSGDFFMEPEQEVIYAIEAVNNSVDANGNPMAVTDVTVALALRDWETFDIVDLIALEEDLSIAAGDDIYLELIDPYVFPEDAGRYVLQFQVWHDDDVDLEDNNMWLQQDVVDLPFEFAYDEDDATTAHAFYYDGFGFANTFWYEGAAMKINEIKIEMRDASWPENAQGNLKYAIFPDDGTGIPDMDNPLVPITQTTCQLGAWNTFDVSSYNAEVAAGEKFHVAYFQVGDAFEGAPGILGDKNEPISSWITSLAYDPDEDLWEGPAYYDEDLCIRVVTEEVIQIVEVDTPENVMMYLDGYPVISWDAVEGAESYNVYGSDDPYAPMSEWTLVEAGIQDLGYYYEGEEDFHFFVVTASSELDGSKSRKASEPVALKAPKKTINPNIIREIDQVRSNKVLLDTEINRSMDKNSKIPAGFRSRNLRVAY